MFDREDHESHESSSDLGEARSIFLSPTGNAFESITTEISRKRKLTDVEHEADIGEAFAIKV